MWLKNGFRYNLLVCGFPLLNHLQYLFLLCKIVKKKYVYCNLSVRTKPSNNFIFCHYFSVVLPIEGPS